jgi:ADP-heptose:LPS heptosyltransferase
MGQFLFIRGGAVGDFILTMPAIRLVREQLPDNEIEILGYPAITELATATGLADRTRSIEDSRLAAFFAPGAELDKDWCEYLSGFDVVVSYLYDPDGFFAANLERAGVKTLVTGPFRPEEGSTESAAAQLARPLERFALFLDDPELQLDYGAKTASPLAGKNETDSETVRIAIHPGSGSPSKNWSFESWLEVLRHLDESFDSIEFVVTSGEAEHEVIAGFLFLVEDAGLVHHHLGRHSLAELGAVFAEVDFFLGHDSGISHLAASAGAEGLLLFGPTDPDVWAPVSSRVRILRSNTKTLGGIGVPEVVEILDRWSSSHPSRREDF